jgi:hypothetical protein
VDGVIAVASELVGTIKQPLQIVGCPRRPLPSVRRHFGYGASELFALPSVASNRVPFREGFLPASLAHDSEQPRQFFMQIVPFVND